MSKIIADTVLDENWEPLRHGRYNRVTLRLSSLMYSDIDDMRRWKIEDTTGRCLILASTKQPTTHEKPTFADMCRELLAEAIYNRLYHNDKDIYEHRFGPKSKKDKTTWKDLVGPAKGE